MEYKNLIRDFAERTLKNLEFVEAAVNENADSEIFEVTQLVNSMLGLLVFPRERFFKQIPESPLQELRANGWPIPKMKGSPPRAQNLRDLVSCRRHGIAHCNVEFISDGRNLTGLRIWNYPPGSRTKDWEAELGLSELRKIARKFISLLLEADK